MGLAGTQNRPQLMAEGNELIVSGSTASVPRLTGGRPSNEMVTNDLTLLQPIFILGGDPPGHENCSENKWA